MAATASRSAAKRSAGADSAAGGATRADGEFSADAKSSCAPFGALQAAAVPDAEFEMAEHASGMNRHVYANPNYPAAMEIGGLPFYLMSGGSSAPLPSSSTTTGSSSAPPSSSSPSERAAATQLPHLYEPGYSAGSVRSGGPIYEDIDRMCTYRGAPPPPAERPASPAARQRPARRSGRGSRNRRENEDEQLERAYYNVSPRNDSASSDVTSSPRPANHHNTSSSEVSFESVGSPRRLPDEGGHRANVIVNPAASPAHRRTLAATPRGSPRAPQPASPSVYYYSDTLRPRRRDEDDSGSSEAPALPSARLAALAASPGRRAATGLPKKRTALL